MRVVVSGMHITVHEQHPDAPQASNLITRFGPQLAGTEKGDVDNKPARHATFGEFMHGTLETGRRDQGNRPRHGSRSRGKMLLLEVNVEKHEDSKTRCHALVGIINYPEVVGGMLPRPAV